MVNRIMYFRGVYSTNFSLRPLRMLFWVSKVGPPGCPDLSWTCISVACMSLGQSSFLFLPV